LGIVKISPLYCCIFSLRGGSYASRNIASSLLSILFCRHLCGMRVGEQRRLSEIRRDSRLTGSMCRREVAHARPPRRPASIPLPRASLAWLNRLSALARPVTGAYGRPLGGFGLWLASPAKQSQASTSAARYRDRHSVSRKKSDPGDALALANIRRTDMHAHRPLPEDSDLGRAIAVLARAQADALWSRQQIANQLRSLLREYTSHAPRRPGHEPFVTPDCPRVPRSAVDTGFGNGVGDVVLACGPDVVNDSGQGW
jgi:hypothetical protein